MRPGLIVTMLLLLPLVQGLAPAPLPEPPLGEEQVLILDEGVWSQELWVALYGAGYTPLRMVSPAEILVWSSPDSIGFSGAHSNEAPDVQFKGDFGHFAEYDSFRFAFEPNLPAEAVEQLVAQFENFNLDIEEQAEHYSSVIPHVEVVEWRGGFSALASLDGLLWVEPVLETSARNELVGSLLQHGSTTGNPAWELGLNGEGVVVAVADSGIDADHACFRNATAAGELGSEGEGLIDGVGTPGLDHRKVLLLNHSIDSSDTPGHDDYRHGTHVAGTLSCYNIYDMRSDSLPQNGSSLSYATQLIFQDIVSEDGWVPPEVDALLVEAGLYGATLHSNSWGDDTTAYTLRTSDFDAWALEMPWSLAFIAPGNNGGQLLEPANGRNVIAVGASVKSESSERWGASSIGPTESGSNGIFALAIGSSVQSARADGMSDSYNGALRSSSGTSMATPAATSTAALIQQMVEQGWISGNEIRTLQPVNELRPGWVGEGKNTTNTLSLAAGFSPSGPLLRTLLSLATTPLSQDMRNGESGGFELQNTYDGWGQINLSELVNFAEVEIGLHQGDVTPAEDVWIHDSYRLLNQTPQEWLLERQGGSNALENLVAAPWDGSGAAGPFLEHGDVWVERFDSSGGSFDARLAWAAAPEPHLVDDLQLIVRLSDGRVAVANHYQADGDSTLYVSEMVNFSNTTVFPQTNETTLAVSLSEEDIEGVEWIEVEVRGRYISPSNTNNSVGIDGSKVGFALAVQGIQRDSDSWEDSDGDGVPNVADDCPNQNATAWDSNEDGCIDDSDGDAIGDDVDVCPGENSSSYDDNLDGCIDDSDGDGVVNSVDECPNQNADAWDSNGDGCIDDSDGDSIGDDVDVCLGENASSYDDNLDGCIDDSDGDGVFDNNDLCFTVVVSTFWPVDLSGCRPVDSLPSIDFVLSPEQDGEWYDALVIQWSVEDENGDAFDTGAEIHVLNASISGGSYPITSCLKQNVVNGTFTCTWYIPKDLPVWDIQGELLQIEVHAQSRNLSPEGKNDIVLLRDDVTFTSNWNAPLLENNETDTSSVEAVTSVNQAFAWGLFAIIAGFVLIFLLSRSIRRDKVDEKFQSAFAGGGDYHAQPSNDESR